MSERYLITQSLLSSYAYQFECREECAADARDSFLAALRREKTEITEAMRNGIDFENAVYTLASGDRGFLNVSPACLKWESGIREVASFITGAMVQVRLKREIEVDGLKFLVYGVLDALKAGVIYDVKFKNKSFKDIEVYGDYVDSPQHPAYFYLCPEAHEFRYLVSDGDGLYMETYRPEDTRFIGDLIHDFLQGITASGDLATYKEHWRAKE